MKFVWSESGSDEAFLEALPTTTLEKTLHIVYDKFQPSVLGEGGLKDSAAPWLERVADLVEANKKTLETVRFDVPFVPQITSSGAIAFTFFASRSSRPHLDRLLNRTLRSASLEAFVCGIPLRHFEITSVMTIP